MKDLAIAIIMVLMTIAIVIGIVSCNTAINRDACINLADDINRSTIFIDNQCWIEVCADVRMPQSDIKYHIDLIQSCQKRSQ